MEFHSFRETEAIGLLRKFCMEKTRLKHIPTLLRPNTRAARFRWIIKNSYRAFCRN